MSMSNQKMVPFKIYAYEVIPQRLQGTSADPKGGAFEADAPFKLELEKYLEKSKLPKRPEVAFRIDTKSKTGVQDHPVRGRILKYCFGEPSTARKASLELAKRLGKSMDDRSPYTLLLFVAYKGENDDSYRRLVLWAFPKDEPFQFSAKAGGKSKIVIPKNIFSRSSSFKKGSLYQGYQNDSAFLQGFVIDRQAENSWGTAADYWVSSFLDSQFTLSGMAGTRLLARTLKLTHDELTEQKDKNQITDSIRAAFISNKRRFSMQQYANEYLKDSAKSTFIAKAPPETVKVKFDFDKTEFEEKVQLRVFRLDNDVVVSAPFSTINNSVKLTGKDSKKIRVTGTIVEETVKPGKKKKKKVAKKKVAKRVAKKKSMKKQATA